MQRRDRQSKPSDHLQQVAVRCGSLAGMLLVLLTGPLSAQTQFTALAKRYTADIKPLLKSHCLSCHNNKKQEADLNLQSFKTLADVRKQPRVWQKVRYMVVNKEMPPKKSKQLSRQQYRLLLSWTQQYLQQEAAASAGDPGRVVLRRLNNVEYDNSIGDLTGQDLHVSKEFPADSAAGEGFTNTGDSLAMSPALLDKYLNAARELARHAVLTPNGFRFSQRVTRRDWIHEVLDEIRAIHERHTTLHEIRNRGAVTRIQWGKVPLLPYLQALVKHRSELTKPNSVARIARLEKLNVRYLGFLRVLMDPQVKHTQVVEDVARQLQQAQLQDLPKVVKAIEAWQERLWDFKPVGQFFRPGQLPKSPVAEKRSFRIKVSSSTTRNRVDMHLAAGAAGASGTLVWRNPRFESKRTAPIALRDLRELVGRLHQLRTRSFRRTADYLNAVAVVSARPKTSLERLAKARQLELPVLQAWVQYLYLRREPAKATSQQIARRLFKGKRQNVQGQKFIRGWARSPTSPLPTVLANHSDKRVRIPGIFRPHTIFVHPSPSHYVGLGWKSPIRGLVRVQVAVEDTHPECGNGQEWTLLWQNQRQRQRLGAGVVDKGKAIKSPVFEDVYVQPGDMITLAVGPRDRNHACDASQVDMTITEVGAKKRIWGLAKDNAANIHAGNPHPDGYGNQQVWHFYDAPTSSLPQRGAAYLPLGSKLSKWRTAIVTKKLAVANRLAKEIEKLLVSQQPPRDPLDLALYRQLRSVSSPLFQSWKLSEILKRRDLQPTTRTVDIGLAKTRFVNDPTKGNAHSNNLVIKAPQLLRFALPADLLSDYEFVVDAAPTENSTVQVRVGIGAAAFGKSLDPTELILAGKRSAVGNRMRKSFADFRALFPSVMCCRTIVPLDNVVTLVQFHREDEHLSRLILSDAERQELNRLWSELRYISRDAIKVQDTFDLFIAFASQVGKVPLFEPLRKGVNQRAVAFRKYMLQREPAHLEALLRFAARAFRRPLTGPERTQLVRTYKLLRSDKQTHDEAVRGVIMRILVSPRFLYRIEKPPAGKEPGPVSDYELATRLSYFLWSTLPDRQLRAAAKSGLQSDKQILKQTRRMLLDPKVRALATEFACQWLGFQGFDQHNDKNERQYPQFKKLRGAMYEESVRFFTDLFQRDGSILEIINADHSFLNEALAKHYGVKLPAGNQGWQRVSGLRKKSRGGVLGMSVMLAKQSGATRTSPVLRGNWIVETLLGERIPDPPPTVPDLPDAVNRQGLTVRQLTEKHVRAPQCASCHVRIDPYGFALESFDAIGRFRTKDLVNKPVDTRAKLRDGSRFQGVAGLRNYILQKRRDDFVKQFCRKVLGFSLGRAVQLSDEPLLATMQARLRERQYRVSVAIETIVRSKQFRYHRGLEATREPRQ